SIACAYPAPSEAVFMLHYVPRYMVKRAPELSQRGYRYADGPRCIFEAPMKVSVIRVIATLLLSGQTLSVGLPLFCDQVQRATSANCGQQMASHRSGPAVAATTHATPCANPAFCAITAPALVTLGGAVSASPRESHIVGFGVSTLAPA